MGDFLRKTSSTVATIDRDAKGGRADKNVGVVGLNNPGLTRRLFSQMPTGSAEISKLYKLALLDMGLPNQIVVHKPIGEALDPSGQRKSAEYIFHVPPKSIDVMENFTTVVQPTLDNGKFIESQGSVVKNITISGTTGLRPRANRSSSFFQDLTAGPINKLASLEPGEALTSLGTSAIDAFTTAAGASLAAAQNTVPSKEITGHDDIIFLRNIFREYSDIQSSGAHASSLIMVWYNQKDGEYWVVEPRSFRISQSSSSPLLYFYTIELQTIFPFDPTFNAEPESKKLTIKDVINGAKRAIEYTQAAIGVYVQISAEVSRLTDSKLWPSAIFSLLGPLNSLIDAIADFSTTRDRINAIAFQRARKLQSRVQEAYEQVRAILADEEAANPGSGKYDPVDLGVALRLAAKVGQTAEAILTDPVFRDSVQRDVEEGLSDVTEAYSEKEPFDVSPKDSPDAPPVDQLRTTTVSQGDTLRSIALRENGTADLAIAIAVINGLVSPYIAATRSAGVLTYGDTIYVPLQPRASTATGTSTSPANVTRQDEDAGGAEQISNSPAVNSAGGVAAGTDVLTTTPSLDEGTDLVVSAGGDIETVQGLPNIAQAVFNMLLTERGELIEHPTYGLVPLQGKRAERTTFTEYSLNIRSMLLSDSRIESIQNLNIYSSGDNLRLDISVRPTGTFETISTSLALRN